MQITITVTLSEFIFNIQHLDTGVHVYYDLHIWFDQKRALHWNTV